MKKEKFSYFFILVSLQLIVMIALFAYGYEYMQTEMFKKWLILSGITFLLLIVTINSIYITKIKKYATTIEEMSNTDDMTTLYNRRYFNNEFPKLIKIHKRLERNLIFFMIDIDNFKLYNEIHGHDSGNLTLKAVAKK